MKANRVSWVKRLLSGKGKWTAILSDLIKPISLDHFLQTNLSDDDIACIPILFYRQILKYWNEIKVKPKNPKQFMEEILWDNRYIQTVSKIKKKDRKHSIFDPKLYKAGVTRVKDLLDKNGKILDFNAFTVKYNIKCNILHYYKITKAIPVNWLNEIEKYVQVNQLTTISETHCLKITCNDLTVDIHKALTKTICNCFIKLKYETPSALKKWENIYDPSPDWKDIFKLLYVSTRETQLQSLQY